MTSVLNMCGYASVVAVRLARDLFFISFTTARARSLSLFLCLSLDADYSPVSVVPHAVRLEAPSLHVAARTDKTMTRVEKVNHDK